MQSGARVTARLWLRRRLRATVLLLQLRTRVIDDDVRSFTERGGRQLVLLGAGFDCRAWRLKELRDTTVFEVDHPATQRKKQELMREEPTAAGVVFVPWDFERESLSRLPARLGLSGHDARSPTMTVLEGVLPYLREEAVDATFACIARYGSPGSSISFTYLERELLADRSRVAAAERLMVRPCRENRFHHGFDPHQLKRWLATRGFRLIRDESSPDLGARLLERQQGRETTDDGAGNTARAGTSPARFACERAVNAAAAPARRAGRRPRPSRDTRSGRGFPSRAPRTPVSP